MEIGTPHLDVPAMSTMPLRTAAKSQPTICVIRDALWPELSALFSRIVTSKDSVYLLRKCDWHHKAIDAPMIRWPIPLCDAKCTDLLFELCGNAAMCRAFVQMRRSAACSASCSAYPKAFAFVCCEHICTLLATLIF